MTPGDDDGAFAFLRLSDAFSVVGRSRPRPPADWRNAINDLISVVYLSNIFKCGNTAEAIMSQLIINYVIAR